MFIVFRLASATSLAITTLMRLPLRCLLQKSLMPHRDDFTWMRTLPQKV